MTPLPPGTDVARALERLGVQGRLRGRRYWALCPYHDDKHPSWMIRLTGDRAGNFHCFVCKKSGDLYHLIQHLLQVPFKQSVAWLAEQAPRPPPQRIRFVARPMEFGFCLPRGVEVAPLAEWIPIARSYTVGRGITAEQVDQWRLGYAADGPLEGRIVFPTYDPETGVPTSYTARTFCGHERRYMAADSWERPDPGAIFGEEDWPPVGPARRALVVLEGAINALAVKRLVPDVNVGALGGSNPTVERVLKASTFERVFILTDNDLAGKGAADDLRAALARHVRIELLQLPDRRDPADLEQQAPGTLLGVLAPVLGPAA